MSYSSNAGSLIAFARRKERRIVEERGMDSLTPLERWLSDRWTEPTDEDGQLIESRTKR